MSSSGNRDPHTVTVLVVDDEASVLALVRTMLWRAGYTVLEASGGEEALRVAAGHGGPIHLLLTDVLMPDMNGYEVAEKVVALRPDIRVLYMSGYRDKVIVESTGRQLSNAPMIRKPFTQHILIDRIAETLEEAGDTSSVQPLS
jgi:two-component system cell cycle sensor histidine kinase/response regulator CckA